MNTLTISGVTLTINDQGIMIKDGFFLAQQITIEDVIKIRDFLNDNYSQDGDKQ